jgi:hypothetical protein
MCGKRGQNIMHTFEQLGLTFARLRRPIWQVCTKILSSIGAVDIILNVEDACTQKWRCIISFVPLEIGFFKGMA